MWKFQKALPEARQGEVAANEKDFQVGKLSSIVRTLLP